MTLNPGTRVGPYEIIAQLGVGGMGEVYRARDTNLKRDVAIKVLAASLGSDAERLARFQREAEILAALNHPNIAHIHGLEKSDGTIALVMELVEGPTLADRIAKGAVPIDEALPIAKQIVEALEAAHERGIIHRDLKPANIKVRPDGTVKVLDFGLAKAVDSSGAPPNVSMSPTITSPAHLRQGYGGQAVTQAGMILGTAAYMSPEQAVGKPVDRRTDLWSFGVVLLEMLTGGQVFHGDTVSHVLASVLRDEPDWMALPANTPTSIRRLLRRCLEKDHKRRLADAADARLEVEEALTAPASSSEVRQKTDTLRTRTWIPWSVAALMAVSLVAVSFVLTPRSSAVAAAAPIRFTVPSPPDGLIASSSAADAPPSISPDGRMIVFGISGNDPIDRTKLWLRRLDSLDLKALDGTDGASWPFWSPDSRSIAFFADGQLKVIAAEGGQARTICNVSAGRGGTWNTKGVILFSGANGRLMRVPAAGGEPSVLREIDKAQSENFLRSPSFLPDDTHFLYSTQIAGRRSARLSVGSLDSSASTFLRDVDLNASYANGYIVFAEGHGRLEAQPFDLSRLSFIGDARIVANDFARSALATLHSHFSVAQNGVLEYQPASILQSELVLADRRGNTVRTIVDDGNTYLDPAISPDGRYLTADRFDRATGDPKVWLFDLERTTSVPLSPGLIDDAFPAWTRDGSTVVFSAPANDAWGLYRRRPNSSTTPELLLSVPTMVAYPNDVSPDGKTVAYMTIPPGSENGFDVNELDIDRRKSMTMFGGPATQHHARYSPDGKWIAYGSNESGHFEVYVESTDSDKVRVVVSGGGGDVPRWRADGRELFYMTQNGKGTTVYSVSVESGSPPKFGAPVALFSNDRLATWPAPTANGMYYDVSPDGQSFVLALRKKPSGQSPISVIVNWPSLLEK